MGTGRGAGRGTTTGCIPDPGAGSEIGNVDDEGRVRDFTRLDRTIMAVASGKATRGPSNTRAKSPAYGPMGSFHALFTRSMEGADLPAP
jgi:hypothetical protein